jgi:hypothetical protein
MIWEPPFVTDSVAPELDPANFDVMATNFLDDTFVPLLPPAEWASDWGHSGWRDPNFTSFTMDHYI